MRLSTNENLISKKALQEHHLQVQKTARYYCSAPPSAAHRRILYALHGYGQLAPFFARKFANLGMEDLLVVVPEGLNRFYLSGTHGRVGATWMTKEDRLTDIEDYCRYLEQLKETVETDLQIEQRLLLGFSQGTATACRWLVHSSAKFNGLINWAGAFPPDLDYRKAYADLQDIPVYMVKGSEDEFISDEKLKEHLAFLDQQKIKYSYRNFEGKHTVDPKVLKEILMAINREP